MASPSDPGPPLSLFDRLLDEESAQDRLAAGGASDRFQYLKDCVRRDLEALLNSRRRYLSTPRGLTEVEDSVFTYGIPDFSGANLASDEQREAFRAAVEEALRRHEPRFHSVAVTLTDNTTALERVLRFRIEASIQLPGESEPVVIFDSILEPVAYSVAVASGDGNG